MVALPLHLLLDPSHSARPQLLEVVHRARNPLHHREALQVRQLHEPEGQDLGHHGGYPALQGMEMMSLLRGLVASDVILPPTFKLLNFFCFSGGVSGDQAAAALRLQAGRLHLRQHPRHCDLRVAPLHHQLGAGAGKSHQDHKYLDKFIS